MTKCSFIKWCIKVKFYNKYYHKYHWICMCMFTQSRLWTLLVLLLYFAIPFLLTREWSLDENPDVHLPNYPFRHLKRYHLPWVRLQIQSRQLCSHMCEDVCSVMCATKWTDSVMCYKVDMLVLSTLCEYDRRNGDIWSYDVTMRFSWWCFWCVDCRCCCLY